MQKPVLMILAGGVIAATAGGGFYYYQQQAKPSGQASVMHSSPASNHVPVNSPVNHQLNPDAGARLNNAINTLATSTQFDDFIKTDQLLQTALRQIPLAQRYEVMERFLQAVNQHIEQVEGKKQELSRHDQLFLESMTQFNQAGSETDADVKPPQSSAEQQFAAKLITVLPPLQANWLTQALKHDFDILNVGEGFYTIRLNPDYLVKRFAPVLPEADQIFIKALAQQNQEQFHYDAAIAIPWTELGERAIFWENYARQYPSSFFANDANVLANHYLYFLIYGMDNTQPLEYINGPEDMPVINKQAAQAFKQIKHKYPDSKVSATIKQLEQLLANGQLSTEQRIIAPVELTKRSILMGQL